MVTEADSNIIPHGLPGAGGRQQRAGPGGGYSQVLERFMIELDHGFLLHRPTEAHDHGEKDSYPDISGIFVDCITSKSAISPSISDTMVTSLLGMRQSSW